MNKEKRAGLTLLSLLGAMLLVKGIAELTGTMTYLRPLGLALTVAAAFSFIALVRMGMEEFKNEKKTRREKYLEQLESQRKAGLIDRDEYDLLRERYQKMENPKDEP